MLWVIAWFDSKRIISRTLKAVCALMCLMLCARSYVFDHCSWYKWPTCFAVYFMLPPLWVVKCNNSNEIREYSSPCTLWLWSQRSLSACTHGLVYIVVRLSAYIVAAYGFVYLVCTCSCSGLGRRDVKRMGRSGELSVFEDLVDDSMFCYFISDRGLIQCPRSGWI